MVDVLGPTEESTWSVWSGNRQGSNSWRSGGDDGDGGVALRQELEEGG